MTIMQQQKVPQNTSLQKTSHKTGIPDSLQQKFESFSGLSFHDVQVHYHSNLPNRYDALAIAHGPNIYISSGQEQLLAHELSHVLSQKQSSIGTTDIIQGKRFNLNPILERQADDTAKKVMSHHPVPCKLIFKPITTPIMQMAKKTKDELCELTFSQFQQHIENEQMDWANLPEFTAIQRENIWKLLDCSASGISNIKLKDLCDIIFIDNDKIDLLNCYIENIAKGTIRGNKALQLKEQDSLPKILQDIEALFKIRAKIGFPETEKRFSYDEFTLLIHDSNQLDKFISYIETCSPYHQEKDILSRNFRYLYQEKSSIDFPSLKAKHPTIKQFHVFFNSSLQKLENDSADTTKPLTIILIGVYDPSGAFTRASDIKEVIENTNIKVMVIEGDPSHFDINAAKETGLQPFTSKGLNGKINQVMIAGHGNSKLINIGVERGTADKDGHKTDDPAKIVSRDARFVLYMEFSMHKDLWTSFFQKTMDVMEDQNGISAKIVLNACLTDSNQVDMKSLSEKLNQDDPTILTDPVNHQAEICAAIVSQFQRDGNLASQLRKLVPKGKTIKVVGAVGSISSYREGSIKPTGEIGIIPRTTIDAQEQDLYITGAKIEYLEYGLDASGVIKALIESWANDRVTCFEAVERRIAKPAPNFPNKVIQLLLTVINSNCKNDILKANKFVGTANVIHGIEQANNECRVRSILDDPMIKEYKTSMMTPLSNIFIKPISLLVLYEAWIDSVSTKIDEFFEKLENPTLTRTSISDFIDITFLERHTTALFQANSSTHLQGQCKLALQLYLQHNNINSKNFLIRNFADDLIQEIKDVLDGYSEESLKRMLKPERYEIHDEPRDPAVLASVPPHTKNIDTANSWYVRPCQPTIYYNAYKLHVKRVDILNQKFEVIDHQRDGEFMVIGEVLQCADHKATNYFMIRTSEHKIAYIKRSEVKKDK